MGIVTCIVGITDAGSVWLGGDSVGSDGWRSFDRLDRKVFRRGPLLLGFTSSYRMGQLLQYRLQVPSHPDGVDDHEYMATVFIDAVRQCLKDGGYAKKESEVEKGGTFIVGYRSQLYRIEDDYQVGMTADGFDAVGCGERFALGALHATPDLDPQRRIVTALMAASRFSNGVGPPFHVLVGARA